MADNTAFASKLGLAFKNPDLLAEALTHRSYLNENKEAKVHNERLEFLGDAVLELAVTRFLYDKFPEKPEGELTAYRAALVNTVSLAESAATIGMNDHVLLSKGEAKDTGRARQIILANAFEAVIGAIYLDQGYAAAEAFIGKQLYGKIDDVIERRSYQDAKSRFQEAAQDRRGITPSYELISEEGPDHDRVFTVGAMLGRVEAGRGEGHSKQEAEQDAAGNALEKMGW
jgi:ribonuclease-3